MLQFEHKEVTDYGPCKCCGDVSRLASGMIRLDDKPYAAYQVHWTAHQVSRHGAEFYVILGQWGIYVVNNINSHMWPSALCGVQSRILDCISFLFGVDAT